MIRPFSRIPRSASVLAGLVVLAGCAAHRADLPPPTADPMPRPAAIPPVAARPRPEGHIAIRPGRAGHVVASHGTADAGPGDIGDIAAEIARRTGFGLVVVSGFAAAPDNGRPAAREVSELYEQRVLQASQGPLRFYAEIHGGHGTPCAAPIEIATVGVDRELALRLRALAELIRDAHLRTRGEIDRVPVLIEPVDPLTDRAARTRRDGILRLPERALQIELPRCARRDWREAYTAILADFLAQAVALPIGR
jgi:hypothetical protein